MKFLRHWKIILCLCAIFVAGGVTGAMVAASITKKVVRKHVSQQDFSMSMLRRYEAQLELTPEQKELLKPHFEEAAARLRNIRSETMKEIFFVVRDLNSQVEKDLTPEQQERFAKMREDIRARAGERQPPAARPNFQK